MTLKEFQNYFIEELSEYYPNTEIQSFLSIALEEYLGFQRIDLITKSDYIISDKKLQSLTQVIKRLTNQEPIQYIIGKCRSQIRAAKDEHKMIADGCPRWILTIVSKTSTKLEQDYYERWLTKI